MSSGQPYDADVWKQLSALGLTGLIIPAEHGGAEAGYSILSVALNDASLRACVGPSRRGDVQVVGLSQNRIDFSSFSAKKGINCVRCRLKL